MSNAPQYTEITVTPYSPALGALISGIDLAKPISETALKEMKDAFARYSVIFFRDQDLSPQQHIDVAKRWATST